MAALTTVLSLQLHLFLKRGGRWGTAVDFVTSFLHFSLFSTALWDLANSRPVHSLMFPPPPLSALSSSPFHYASQVGLGQTWWTGHISIPLQFTSLYDGQEVFVWSDCLLDLSFWPLSNVDFRQTRPLITRKTAASLFLFCFLIPFLSIGPMIVLCFGSLLAELFLVGDE